MTSWRWPCSACTAASASSAAIRSSGVSPMPTRMPLVNGILSSPAARIVCRRSAGSFVGDPWWATRSARVDSSMSPCEAVTPRSRARSSRLRAPRFVCGSRPRSSARSQHQTTYATKSSKPSPRRRSLTPGTLSGTSPVRTSSSLTPRRAALSMSRSTSSGSCRCGRWVANAQYLQCDTHERESESVTLREKVTRRRIRGSLCTAPRPPARRPRAAAARGGPRCHAGAAVARRLALAVLLAALGLVAAGCAGLGGGVTDASPTLELDGPPSAVDAGLYLALQRDYDGDEGLDMRVRKPASPADAVRRLLDGRAQVALLDIHDLARARDRGRDLVGVMALVQRPLAAVLAAPGVRPPRALDGRRVATTGARADAAVLAAIVRHDGGDPGTGRRVRRRPDRAAAVASGRVAAATGRWSTDGIRLLGRRPKAHAFRADDYGARAYPEIVLCVTRATLQDDRNVVRAAVNALRRGYEEALVDPESAVGALVDAVPGLDRAAMQDAFDAVSPAFLEGVTRFGDLDAPRLRTWARWEAREGIVRRPPDVGLAFALGF